GYNAVMAYTSLFEATGSPKWLELASRAADWSLSFRWAHNLEFPPGTVLQEHDFRTRGADVASSTNQHLHAYAAKPLDNADLTHFWRKRMVRVIVEQAITKAAT